MIKHVFTIAATVFAAQAFAGPVNVNTADADALATELTGVGPIVAQRIVDYRATHGGFKEAQQLQNIRGIGPRTLEKNAEFILLK